MTIQKGLIGRQDFNRWTGNSEKTFSRKTATGGTVTLFKIDDEVDVFGLYAGNIGECTDNIISKALATIGSNNRILLLTPTVWQIENDLTIPTNAILHIPFGATLNIASGKTLTCVKSPIAGPYQIFTGSGTATITGYPQDRAWWGETQRNDFSNVTIITFVGTTATITKLTGGEIKDSLISYYDFNDQLIHQISSNEILSLNETFSFA